MEAVIVMRVHLLVYCLFTAVCAHDGSPAVMCEPTSKMSTTAAAPLSIPVNSDVFLSESIAIVQERRAVDFNTRQKKARSQSSSAPCYIFFCSLLYFPLLLAISSSAPCYIFFCSLLYFPLLLAIYSSAPCYIFLCSLPILWLQRQATCSVHLQPLHSDFLAIVDPNHRRVHQEQ